MRKTTTDDSWKRAMLHAWLGFILLLAFYLLTFGIPWTSDELVEKDPKEQTWIGENEDPVVLTGLRE